jgi:serine/threonine-protein kinase mTOR
MFYFLQYKKWDETENRLLRRELFISDNLSVQKYTQCPPDVISDPLDDFEGVPFEEADETQRQPRSHQVICFVVPAIFYRFLHLYSASY